MGKKAKAPSGWAVQSGRLLSLSAAVERQMKDLLVIQTAKQGAVGGVRDVGAGAVYGKMRQAAEALSDAFHLADNLRAIEQAEDAGKRAAAVGQAFKRVFP